MGEQKQRDVLDNTNSNNPIPPQENQEPEPPNEEPEQEQLTEVEYQQLDTQLDALFTALDDIENKNDNIHAQLLQLLDANREVRKQLSAVEKDQATSDDKSDTSTNENI